MLEGGCKLHVHFEDVLKQNGGHLTYSVH